MSARLAVHVPLQQLPEVQRAARCLLRTPLVTSPSADFRLVRRWETVLRNEFGQKLGYRLDVSRTAARLLRRPASVSPRRGARLQSGRDLTRWAYVYLCLTLAAIEQPGQQILASELLSRIEQGTRGDDRLRLDFTEFAQRKAFRDAVRYLEQIGVLHVRDGNVDGLVSDGQVLFDIDRDAAEMCMVASPSILREVRDVDDFLDHSAPTTTEARNRWARQRLNRRMIDQPMVAVADLDHDEAELAWRNRRREAENISRLTGCTVELRSEGLALIDHPQDPISRRAFPSNDSIAHAALLLLDELLTASTEPATTSPIGPADDVVGTHRHLSSDVVDACWAAIIERYGDRFAKVSREHPEQFRRDCVDLLTSFSLIRSTSADHALDVSAFASRFRAEAELVDGPTASTNGRRTDPEPALF